MNAKQHWESIRQIAADLDPDAHKRDLEERDSSDRKHLERSQKEIWLTSLGDDEIMQRAGVVVNAWPWNAAQRLKEKTHRLATPEEIEEWHREQAARRKQHDAAELARKQAVHTTVTIDPAPLVEGIVAGLAAQAAEKPTGRQRPTG